MRYFVFLFLLCWTTLLSANESSDSSGSAVLSTPDGSPLAVDGFGVLRTSQQGVAVSMTFEGDTVDPTFIRDLSTGDGALSQANGVLTLTGGTGTAVAESVEVLRYVTKTGLSWGGTLGVTAGTGPACLGVRDASDNGSWVCIENGDIKLYRGNSDGVVSACASGCDETLTGSMPDGFDATKLNIFQATAGYYGVKNITWTIEPPGVEGAGHVLHVFKTQGAIDKPHIGVPRLPIRITAGAGVNAITASAGAAIDGAIPASRDIPNCFRNGVAAIADQNETVVVGFRIVETFRGETNTIAATATRAVFGSDLDGVVSFQIRANPTITNTPTWSNIRGDNESVIEYSTDITVDMATGVTYAPDFVVGANKVSGASGASLRDIGLRGHRGDVFVLTADGMVGAGAYNAVAGYCWVEER